MVCATPLMTPTTALGLGLSIRLCMFELHETGELDLFVSPPDRARAETGEADQWALKLWEFPGVSIVHAIRPHSWDTPYQFPINTLFSKP